MLHPEIKNVIFDLGGVILDLSVDSTLNEFSKLSGIPIEKIKEKYTVQREFLDYEKGTITSDEFRTALQQIFNVKSSTADIDKCWNAMLGTISKERIQLLRELKTRYRTFLLSNTNAIHLDCFSGIVKKDHQLESLEPLFHKTYYSHLMGMRKPDAEIYEFVLRENGLKAEETIFLDDNTSNLEGAESVGIRTFHIKQPDDIFSVFR